MADRSPARVGGRTGLALLLVAGVAAVGMASVAGAMEGVLHVLVTPPTIVRAGLAGAAIVLGAWLLLAAVRRIDGALRRDLPADGGRISDADLGGLVRAVRLVFLSAAALTAAAGWILAEPLPLVIALVIAGVDVVETSFLLLVASRRGG